MPRLVSLFALVALLGGCDAQVGGAPLVSAQSPPGTGQVNSASEPQPVGSLPPGAAGMPQSGPFATQPNYLAATLHR